MTLRERILSRAETLRRENRLNSETTAQIVQLEDGYRVDFSFHDGEIEFMKLSLYAPDEVQASRLRKRLLEDYQQLYIDLICRLTS